MCVSTNKQLASVRSCFGFAREKTLRHFKYFYGQHSTVSRVSYCSRATGWAVHDFRRAYIIISFLASYDSELHESVQMHVQEVCDESPLDGGSARLSDTQLF